MRPMQRVQPIELRIFNLRYIPYTLQGFTSAASEALCCMHDSSDTPLRVNQQFQTYIP